MPTKFTPKYSITPRIATLLLRIEAAKEKVSHLPLTPSVLASLRETARLYTTHYSTMIEGNRLQPDEIEEVLRKDKRFTGKERDEKEVKGYYAALRQVEEWGIRASPITEVMIKTIHGCVMSGGKTKIKPTPYRDGQNVIRDSRSKAMIYMPPEAKDVPELMKTLVQWIVETEELPSPILAGIAHYQFATIHPYYDGNGRTARLLTTLILHLGGYGLKGLYSLEEYYAQNLSAYYDAISIGPSHNYYLGRAESDITPWIEYFIAGVAIAFENVLERMLFAKQRGNADQAELLRRLDPKQRISLELFAQHEVITSSQIGKLFRFKPRTSAALCKKWTEEGFLTIVDPSNKGRTYRLSKRYEELLRH
jgi:Fic family protein